MTNTASPGSAAPDRALEETQSAYLSRCAPGARTRRVRWSGGTTQIIELGEGLPLLLLHGGMGEAIQWASILPALARSYRVMAVDRPGHGLADPFDHRSEELLSLARRFLGDVLDAEGLGSVPSWFTLIDKAFDFRGLKPELVLGERWKSLSVPTTFVWGAGPVVEAIQAALSSS